MIHLAYKNFHHKYQTNNVFSAQITIKLSQELIRMKVLEFPTFKKCLETFYETLEKFNKLSSDNMHTNLAIWFLKKTTNGNNQLIHAWIFCDTIKESTSAGVAPTYQEYYKFFNVHSWKARNSSIDNFSSWNVNVAGIDYLQPYSLTDNNYV